MAKPLLTSSGVASSQTHEMPPWVEERLSDSKNHVMKKCEILSSDSSSVSCGQQASVRLLFATFTVETVKTLIAAGLLRQTRTGHVVEFSVVCQECKRQTGPYFGYSTTSLLVPFLRNLEDYVATGDGTFISYTLAIRNKPSRNGIINLGGRIHKQLAMIASEQSSTSPNTLLRETQATLDMIDQTNQKKEIT